MRIRKVAPNLIQQFSWNNEEALLASLKNIFSFQKWDENTVNVSKTRNNRVIVIATPNIRIEIKLDLPHWKAISTIKKGTDHKTAVQTYEYKVIKLDSEIVICATKPSSKSITNTLVKGKILESINSLMN